MGVFKRTFQMGKQMADLKTGQPEAWAAGEAVGFEALQTRTDDLATMLIQGPQERVDQYRARMTEEWLRAIGTGEVEPPFWPVNKDSLQAFAIAMGVTIVDALEVERREGRRIVREVE
jgi:hypothetical protein